MTENRTHERKSDAWLIEYAKDVHSQSGEDGILLEVLARLTDKSGWAVEFGAWDGLHCSNTANLIRSHEHAAVMIEANSSRFEDLQRTYRDNPKVHPVRAFVGFTPSDSLDTILRRTPIPQNFDLLSIDIDGNDYHVWSAVTEYRPRIVVIEYNPTIPVGVEFVQPANPSTMQGASLTSLVALGRSKGYELVCVTKFNGIFVTKEDYERFDIVDNSEHKLRVDQSLVTHIFCGYDGTVFIRGCGRLPWHDVPYAEALIQPLPPFLRDWKENYGRIRSKVFGLYRRARKARARLP